MDNKPKCPACGSDLELEIGYTGCDWNCKAGLGSGYGYELNLYCKSCGTVITLGMLKKDSDFSEIKNK